MVFRAESGAARTNFLSLASWLSWQKSKRCTSLCYSQVGEQKIKGLVFSRGSARSLGWRDRSIARVNSSQFGSCWLFLFNPYSADEVWINSAGIGPSKYKGAKVELQRLGSYDLRCFSQAPIRWLVVDLAADPDDESLTTRVPSLALISQGLHEALVLW